MGGDDDVAEQLEALTTRFSVVEEEVRDISIDTSLQAFAREAAQS